LTLAEFNTCIRSLVAIKWYDLGVQLLPNASHKLNVIKANNPADVEQCCMEMYQLWLRSDFQASREKLAVALKKTGFDLLCEKVLSNNSLKGKHMCCSDVNC